MMNKGLYQKYLESLKAAKQDKDKPKSILIIDGLNLYIRSFCAVPTVNKEGLHTGGIYGSLQSMKYAINTINPNKVLVIFDGHGGSARRRQIYSNYKANRRGLKGLNRTFNWLSEEEEEKSCIAQLSRFIEYLCYLPVLTIRVDNIEADDAIAYICRSIIPNDRKVIMSTDKDYYQLVNDNTVIWSPTKKCLITQSYIKDNFGIAPTNFTLYRAIDGDASDNIPGIKGIGLKTFTNAFKEFVQSDTKYEPADLIRFAEKYQAANKVCKILYENREQFELNYKLMQLYDVDISGLAKTQLIDFVKNKKIPALNQTVLRKMLLEDKLYSQIRNFGNWYIAYQDLNVYAMGFNRLLNSGSHNA